MKSFIALIVVTATIPLFFASGYLLNTDPAPPTLKATIERELNPISETVTEEWLYIATKGPLKGQEAEAFYVAFNLDDAALAEAGAEAGGFFVRVCQLYTTSGDINVATDHDVVNACSQRKVSRAAVLEQAKSLESPPLAS